MAEQIKLGIKLWDNYRKEYLKWGKIATNKNPYYGFTNESGSYHIGWSATEYPKRYIMCVSFGQHDKTGVELFSGDRVLNDDNEAGTILFDEKHARLVVKYGKKFKWVETNTIVKVGDTFHDKGGKAY
jgi:hypothetical protein